MNRHVVALLAVAAAAPALTLAACSSSSSSGNSAGPDAGGGDGGACGHVDSACGQPCDKGNSLGVGVYCTGIEQCTSTPKAHLCSSLGNSMGEPPTFFCTFMCAPPDAGGADAEGGSSLPTDCGEGATCTCGGNLCGCTPNSCLGT